MADLNQVINFLSSLSPISRFNFQFWDAEGGLVFSSEADPSKTPAFKELRDFSTRTMKQTSFPYALCNEKYLMCGIPIKKDEGVFGALIAFDLNSENISPPDAAQPDKSSHCLEMERFLSNLAMLVEDWMVSKEELQEVTQELDQSFEDLYLYANIASQIKTLRVSTPMLTQLAEDLLETIRVDLVFTMMPERPQYNVQVSTPEISGKIPDQKTFIYHLIDAIPPNESSLEENYFILNDSIKVPEYKRLAPFPYRFLTVKMEHEDEFYGWVGLVSFNLKEIFRRGELKLMVSMAQQIAMVISNSDLYQDLERFVINMIKSMVFAIEAKDAYTRGHSERVSQYCMLMAEKLNLDKMEKKNLQWASILHDIGKIGIAESVLNKPSRLTVNEYERVKEHPSKGGDILRPVEQLSNSLPGIIHHHERYDGTGYPSGLKGEEIPLQARIIAVADTFDAISSSRAYREAKTFPEALAILEEVAGSQLDPHLVPVFKEICRKDL